MTYREAFDGVICMDALENVFPEDWPLVLSNFHRALKPGGHLYFTVETADEEEVEKAFNRGRQFGLPVIYGECPEESGVYHYYPSMEQVKEWIQQAGLVLLEEGEGDGYYHFIIFKTSSK
jgi:cyclopropane fatty-acyl-phospholipid synthase-like methyltransferase